jgi:hypothetical protein
MQHQVSIGFNESALPLDIEVGVDFLLTFVKQPLRVRVQPQVSRYRIQINNTQFLSSLDGLPGHQYTTAIAGPKPMSCCMMMDRTKAL